MTYHPNYGHLGGHPRNGGGFRGDNRFPTRQDRPFRRDGAPEQSPGHTAGTEEAKQLLGGALFPLCDSPSLRLDKFVTVGNKMKLREIRAVVSLHNRIKPKAPAFVPHSSFRTFIGTLRSNLIVNQAGGVLENAGISIHPHFNVPVLPGSAVKGVARHAAWLQWCAEKDPARKSDLAGRIARTFGYPTRSDTLDKALNAANTAEQSGSVSFMAAYPCNESGEAAPATLAVDILTPHGGNDWTDPVPNPFPVVAKGTSFKFAVGPAGPEGAQCVEDAVRWLQKGLTEGGLGAKTAAGYGAFKIAGVESTEPKKTYTLRLISPAFLRGAEEDEGTLRESSLRGVLRYWWRVVFGSVLSERDLKKLETIIWGGTGKPPMASQIVVRLVPKKQTAVFSFDKESVARQLPSSFQSKRFDKRQNRTVITAPGLAYASYGMDDSGRRRKVIEPGAEWTLEVIFHPRNGMEANVLAVHMDLALKALCTFGGVGAKSRKGFGSLDCGKSFNLEDEDVWPAVVNAVTPFGMTPAPDKADAYSMLSEGMCNISVRLGTKSPWAAVDRIGFALQSTAASLKHDARKAATGLPRKIHGPLKDKLLRHQTWETHQNPVDLQSEGAVKNIPRFASPLFVHVSSGENGMLKVNAIAFSSGLVRPESVSREVLGAYLENLKNILSETNWAANIRIRRPIHTS